MKESLAQKLGLKGFCIFLGKWTCLIGQVNFPGKFLSNFKLKKYCKRRNFEGPVWFDQTRFSHHVSRGQINRQ